MFVLFNIIVSIVIVFVDTFLTVNIIGFTLLSFIYALAVLIPGLAVAIRRLHDVNKSGWFIFVSLIPFIGSIWLLILLCTAGTNGPNTYGEDPK